MGKKSNKVFIIVLIILSLLIIATSLVMIYLKTDLFKNEEQLFYKYAGQKLEAFDMLQAMNTGHDGSLTTLHSNSNIDALNRLEAMVLMAGMDLPVNAIR